MKIKQILNSLHIQKITLIDQTRSLGYKLDEKTLDIDIAIVKNLLAKFYMNFNICESCNTVLKRTKMATHLKKCTNNKSSINDFEKISSNGKIIIECNICKVKLQQHSFIKHLLKSHFNKKPEEVLSTLVSYNDVLTNHELFQIKKKLSIEQYEIYKPRLNSILSVANIKHSQDKENNHQTLKCKFCKEKIKEDNLISHIFLQHFESNREFYSDYLIKFHLHDLSFNQFIKLDNLNLINTKSATLYIDSVIEKLLRIPYFCENNTEYIFIKKWLAKQKSINENLPYIKSISNILKSKFETKIPKQEYIKQNFLTLYATWDNIEFEKGYIKISPKLGVVRPIKIEGSLKILNNIKIEYFKRVHGDEVYKLVFKDGIIQNEFSSGIDKIQKLIQEEGTVATSLPKLSNKTNNFLFSSNCDKDKIQNIIIKSLSHNQYLKKCAALMNEADDVKAFIERNNDINEEALLFIYNCPDKCVMLWENLNSGRAAYVFTVLKKDKKNLYSVLKSLIEGDVSNKRALLYGNNLNFNDFKIKDLNYKCIIHDDINSYFWTLKFLLNRSI